MDLEIDKYLKIWRDRILITKRKDLTPGELSTIFSEKELQNAFFKIIDRNGNGAVSFEEWTGSFSKLIDENDQTKKLNWFVDMFHHQTAQRQTQGESFLTIEDASEIMSNPEFAYSFAGIISPRSSRINCFHFITNLEIIASMSSDTKWLSWLKYQFTEAMIRSNRIKVQNLDMYVTLNDFKENFFFKEDILADRIYSFLDEDRSGTVSLREFINGLEVIVNGTRVQKMEFLFKAFDVDGDERLQYAELRLMLKCCLEESPSLAVEETIDDLASVLFKLIDHDDSGDISLPELKLALSENQSLFKSLSMSTSVWIKPKSININQEQHWSSRAKSCILNNKPHFTFWTMYTLVSLLCMAENWYEYADTQWRYIWARMFGNLLNFNCALQLVLVLRKHLTWLRIKGAAKFLPIDDFLAIHKQVGFVILLYSIVHTVFHLLNLYHHCAMHNINFLTMLFTGIGDKIGGIHLSYPNGIMLLLIYFIICIFALPQWRQHGYFELFYWFHMLTIPFLLILLVHSHNFYMWIWLPLVAYIIEKVLRHRKVTSDAFGDTVISEAYVLPSNVTHLVIRKPPKFRFNPGDYVFVNIPTIAKNEWHPFSLSSAPESTDHLWLHVRGVGNWTKKLHQSAKSTRFDDSHLSEYSHFSHVRDRRVSMRKLMSKSMTKDGLPGSDKAQQNMGGVVEQKKQQKQLQQQQKNQQANQKRQSSIDIWHDSKSKQDDSVPEALIKLGLPSNSVVNHADRRNTMFAGEAKYKVNFMSKSFKKYKNTVPAAETQRYVTEEIMLSECQSPPVQKLVASGEEKNNNNNNNNNNGPAAAAAASAEQQVDNKLSANGVVSQMTLVEADIATPKRGILKSSVDNHHKSKRMNYHQKGHVIHSLDNLNDQNNNNNNINNNNNNNNNNKTNNNDYNEDANTIVGPLKSTAAAHSQSCDLTTIADHQYDEKEVNMFKKNGKDNKVLQIEQIGGTKAEKSDPKKIEEEQEYSTTTLQQQQDEFKSCLTMIPPTSDNASTKQGREVSILNSNDSLSSLKKSNSNNNDDDLEVVIKDPKKMDDLGYHKLYSRANRVNIETIGEDHWRLKVFIDGPYGTPSSDIFDSEHAVLIAAGIGITPFASILQSLMFRHRQARAKCPSCDYKLNEHFVSHNDKLTVKKVDFVWITRDQRSLEWFISLLSQMEIEQQKNNEEFLETHLYVTSAKRQSDLNSIGLHFTLDALLNEEESSLVNGLKQRCHYGRPNFDIVMQSMIRKQQGKISVFYCGPPALSSQLADKCDQYGLTFKKETF